MSPVAVLEPIFPPLPSPEPLLLIKVELCRMVATVIEDVVDEDSNEGEDGGLC